MTKPKHVSVEVSWSNDDCRATADVPIGDWETIRTGGRVQTATSYMYEGVTYPAVFAFNCPSTGELTVSGDDGLVGFVGNIEEAQIVGGAYSRARI